MQEITAFSFGRFQVKFQAVNSFFIIFVKEMKNKSEDISGAIAATNHLKCCIHLLHVSPQFKLSRK